MIARVGIEHADYVLVARLAHANLGPVASRIHYYATPLPGAVGDDPGAAPLVTCVLTRPAGAVVSHHIVLSQAAAGGDLIESTGDVVWAQWVNGLGEIVLQGDASDEAGAGLFKVLGTDGTRLYAGGRFILSGSALV